MRAKAIFSLIFIAVQCKHSIEFSINPLERRRFRFNVNEPWNSKFTNLLFSYFAHLAWDLPVPLILLLCKNHRSLVCKNNILTKNNLKFLGKSEKRLQDPISVNTAHALDICLCVLNITSLLHGALVANILSGIRNEPVPSEDIVMSTYVSFF